MHNSVTESINSILTKRTNFYRIILSHTQCLYVDIAINENVLYINLIFVQFNYYSEPLNYLSTSAVRHCNASR